MNMWNFQKRLSVRLILVNVVNLLIGISLRSRDRFWSAVGTQAASWAVINMFIGLFGLRATSNRQKQIEMPNAHSVQDKERRSLSRILSINIPLNLVYSLGGYQLARRFGKRNAEIRGHGFGIIIQGLILFIFDTIHLRMLRRK